MRFLDYVKKHTIFLIIWCLILIYAIFILIWSIQRTAVARSKIEALVSNCRNKTNYTLVVTDYDERNVITNKVIFYEKDFVLKMQGKDNTTSYIITNQKGNGYEAKIIRPEIREYFISTYADKQALLNNSLGQVVYNSDISYFDNYLYHYRFLRNEQYRDKKCMVIEFKQISSTTNNLYSTIRMWIEKDTGLILKTQRYLKDNTLSSYTEYAIIFDTVSEQDVALPDLTDYSFYLNGLLQK